MAATSAGHLQPQQQHQPTQQQQKKTNTANATMNTNMTRNSSMQQQQHQPQIHNLQQQQHLMQQYALKQQQQHNYNMQQHMHQQQMMQQQQQQQMHQQQMQQQQQMHLKMQQQQMFQNQTSQDAATNMMPCQNYMTPMPQTQNKFSANSSYNNNAAAQIPQQHYQNQFSNTQRAMQQNGNLPAGLVNGNSSSSSNNNNNNNNNINSRATCIPPNVVAPSANQNIYPHQSNNNNNGNLIQQHNHNVSNNNNMLTQQHQTSTHYNQQQQQQQQQQQNQKLQQIHKQTELKNVSHINNARHQLQTMHINTKQHVANNNDNNNCNTNCNANCNTNVASNHFNTNGLNSNSNGNGLNLNSNSSNINNNNHNHTMLEGVKANIPPGWRRLTNNNNEIVYISPTGSTLRSPFQIKDYLLSPGTCKCGLPCPLQPEYFFDFNVQVPNTPLTMPAYQDNNDFNSSTSNCSLTSQSTTSTSTMMSSSLHASCSLQQSALTTSATPSGAFVVPPIDTSSSSTSSSSSSTSSLSSSSLCSGTTTTIPAATSPSSLTCLHLKRFHDCQQLHAHPMESFNKDAKRRKIANTESIYDNNNANTIFSPATTTQTATTESKSIFTSDGSVTDGQQQTSHNSTLKMLPPSLQQQQQQLSNHHQQHQQYMLTNPTYNNNSMMESANKTWPKDDRILPTAPSALTQHESASLHMMNGVSENVQWSSNLSNKPQGICQTKQQQQQQQQQQLQPPTTAAADSNNKEHQQQQRQRQQMDHTSLYKDDLNGYLQQQTTLVHNSMLNLETVQEQSGADADEEGELDEDDEEEGQEEEEEGEEEVEGDEEEDDEKEDLDEHLEEGEILKPNNILVDCITNEELENEMEEENAEEDFNEEEIEEDDGEEPVAEADEEADEEDEEEEEEEEEDNDCETQTVSTDQTVIDKTSLDVSNNNNNNNTNSILHTSNTINFYQMPNSQNQTVKQHHFTNIQNIVSPSQTAISNKFSFNTLKNPTQVTLTQQHPQQNLFKPQQQSSVRTPIKLIPTAQESPVSSSTVGGPRSTPDLQRKTPDNTKKPEQVGAISTSNESPKPCPTSPAGSVESTSSKASNSKAAPSPLPTPITTLHLKPQQQGSLQKHPPHQVRILRHIKNAGQIQQLTQQQPHRLVATNTSRATVTTIAGSRGATTTTTTSSSGQRFNATAPPTVNQKIQATMQKVTANSTTSIPISQLQLQPLLRSNDNTGNSQIIMTSTGQLIVMPSSNNKPHIQQQQQVIIASGNATTTTQSHATTNVIIQQQGTQQMDVLNNTGQLTTATLQQQSNGGFIVSQATNTQGTATQLQPTTVILNSGQNLITNNGTKVLTNTGNIIHTAGTQPIITTANQLLTTPSNAGNTANVLGQQTMVLNALPNGGYVIQQQPQATQTAAQPQQQQFTTLDSQVVQHLVQQPDGRIIITQGDPKRRPKKRKTSPGPTANNPTNITAQISPSIPNQTAALLQQHVANLQAASTTTQATNQPQVVQLTTAPAVNAATTATYPQQFQLGNGIQGIVVNKPASTTTTTQPQQILLQNGQIIQPMNLIGQQLILPSGLVMAPDTTLLQIQNVGSCGPTTNILTTTPQGTMMLRATSPQTNKQFIQSTTTGQQFIVGSNGQLSPIGQIYSTPMGLVMPATTQHNPTATATFVQQNATIQVQQPHHQQVSAPQHITLQALQQHQQNQLNQQQQQHQQHHVVNNQVGIVLETATSSTTSPSNQLSNSRSSAASPPDTTTHSPLSPERPPSHRSGGSDMVQCVSSSEPDGGTISPLSTDSRQSPSTTVCEKGIVMSTAYQNTNIYKPTEAKIRRVQTPPQYQVVGGGGNGGTTTATHITGLTNLTLQQQHHHHQQQQHNTTNNPQHHHADNGGSNKPDTHDSPQNSPTTTLMITPPPPRTPTPQQQMLQNSPLSLMEYKQQQQQPQQQQLKTPTKNINIRNRNRSYKTLPRSVNKSLDMVDTTPVSPSSASPPLASSLQRTFAVGELIWGPARGFPAWPGKVVKILENQPESVWVQWFGGGGRSNTEIMAIHLLQSLSEGLEAHHKAQKDTRKSRKLNSQLEKAIQEAMTELDRISASSTTAGSAKQIQQPTSSTQHQNSPNRANKRPIPRTGGYDLIAGLNNNTSSNVISTTTGSSQSRHKPIRIAPAPPGGAGNSPTKSSSTTSATQMVNSSLPASASK